jgi:hypothetical protein
MIGKIVSHYKILEKLGGGGMGKTGLPNLGNLNRSHQLSILAPTQASGQFKKHRVEK